MILLEEVLDKTFRPLNSIFGGGESDGIGESDGSGESDATANFRVLDSVKVRSQRER